MPEKFIKLNTATGNLEQATSTDVSSGASSAGKIVALDGTGRLDTSMLPAGIGAATIMATASESLTAGDIVNFHDNAGTKSVRRANATDATKPAQGFVLDTVSSSETVAVYTDGQNTQVAVGSFTTADVGKKVFLSTTAGGVTATPPSTTGNIIQDVGDIVDVGGTVTIDFRVGTPIVV